MRKIGKTVLAVCLLLLAALPQRALAVPPIAVDQMAMLTVHYQQDGKQLQGTRFDIYRTADVAKDGTFTVTADFAGFKGELNGVSSAEEWDGLAQELLAAAENTTPMRSEKIGADGSCTFDSLQAGLYLVVGHDNRIGNVTYTCKPFVICLPQYDEESGIWAYTAEASPKAGTPHEHPTPPDRPHDPLLPQTGALRWPIPVMGCIGILSLGVGVRQRRKET